MSAVAYLAIGVWVALAWSLTLWWQAGRMARAGAGWTPEHATLVAAAFLLGSLWPLSGPFLAWRLCQELRQSRQTKTGGGRHRQTGDDEQDGDQ